MSQSDMSDNALLRMRADTDFTYDRRGRMQLTNEPHAGSRIAAPRLFLGRSTEGPVLRFGATLSDAAAKDITAAVERHPWDGSLAFPPSLLDHITALLERDAPVTARTAGPAFRFPKSITSPERAIRLMPANVALAATTFPWLLTELADWGPCFAVVVNEEVAAVCFTSRRGERVEEAGVETLPAYRGRGFAPLVTAAWATAVCTAGRIPIYSTGWDNLASQAVAQKLGLSLFAVDATWK